MSARRENTAIVGVGIVACAACCAGPILGALTAIGLGTAVGMATFGAIAVLVGLAAVAFVLARRRRSRVTCATVHSADAVPVEFGPAPRRS